MAPTQLLYYVITAVDNGTHADRKIGIFSVVQRLVQIGVGRFQQIFGVVVDDAPEQFRLVRFGSEKQKNVSAIHIHKHNGSAHCGEKCFILLKKQSKHFKRHTFYKHFLKRIYTSIGTPTKRQLNI